MVVHGTPIDVLEELEVVGRHFDLWYAIRSICPWGEAVRKVVHWAVAVGTRVWAIRRAVRKSKRGRHGTETGGNNVDGMRGGVVQNDLIGPSEDWLPERI